MSRYEACFYHFLISLAIFVVLAYVILFHWYPDFFYAIDGGWEGMRIIIGVDLILGPMLTLVVFKAGKPGLKFDLAAIGTLQAVCLIAGLAIVYTQRPIFFVYYDEHFYSSSADSYTSNGVTVPDPSDYSDTVPAKVIALLPEHPIEEADFRVILFQDGIPVWAYERTYAKLSEHMEKVIAEGISEEELRDRDDDGKLEIWLEDNGGSFSDYVFIPIHSRYRDAFIGIRKSDDSFVDIIEIPPPL
jgi:hypothetical protein